MKNLNFIIFLIKRIFKDIYHYIKLAHFKIKWQEHFKNNFTTPVKIMPINKIVIGDYSYGPIEVLSWRNGEEKLIIGKYCSIASGVKFILGGNHDVSKFMTYPIKNKLIDGSVESCTKGVITIEEDVWIGSDAIILSGITIGKGSVIAAGSVVTKSFPAFSIIGGNPAKIIKYRFDDDTILTLKDIDYSKIDQMFLKNNLNLLYEEMNINKAEEIKAKHDQNYII